MRSTIIFTSTACLGLSWSLLSLAQTGVKNGEWRSYGADTLTYRG